MHKNLDMSQAVSEVVGEMLMIGILLILAAVFTSQLPNYLPSERTPTVTIVMCNDTQNVTFWHKGGDWVKISSIRVIISNQSTSKTYTSSDTLHFISSEPGSQSFDLGGNISIINWSDATPFAGDEKVVLATDRAVLFSGAVGGGSSCGGS
jgi:archaeal type IV pilus assembly protein PilA